MRRRPPRLITPAAVSVVATVTLAGCTAPVYGTPPVAPSAPRLTVVVPQGSMAPLPEAPPDEPAATFNGLQDRAAQATSAAAKAGADITVLVLDRNTDQRVSNGNDTAIAIASVSKLFIADDLLLQEARGQTVITPEDRKLLDVMLRSSDDSAAEVLWNRSGGDAIITRVATRYGLSSTRPPYDSRWWNTVSTAADLVRYYDMLMNGSGGLPPEQANIILSNLAQSTPTAIDGTQPGGIYPQRFGIPDGLYAEPVAVKQGWMCCIGSDWMHLSTGVIGPDRRFIMVIGSLQPTDSDTARRTITDAVKIMFPGGRI
ncbi:LppW protein [Mycolicibacterium mageritense DSM 44476 = CIP 104973]|uniref:LppW family protein n=1 Tax=Mycolicibacterium mageritense TaxID=53462 RepID=A0ABN5YDI9_MYCME|nr:serine hydrolase [Mycolicibacterium mageritense]MCC9185519.1 serine hydrolase [Mycolicibacterium mageritense]BBX36140.1 LppW family protein [Mycolicibacterium mageritense]CDO24257.1 LppW protein [Mycolicibacterium mageritense DSM 44476 = CIP 104973]